MARTLNISKIVSEFAVKTAFADAETRILDRINTHGADERYVAGLRDALLLMSHDIGLPIVIEQSGYGPVLRPQADLPRRPENDDLRGQIID